MRSGLISLVVAISVTLPLSLGAQQRLSIEEARAEAVKANEQFQILEKRIERSQTIRRQALAGLLPEVGLGLSGTLNANEVELQGRVITPRFDWGGNAYASIMLFDGRQYPLYSEAGLQEEATRKLSEWGRHVLSFEVEQAFYELAAAERELEIAEATVKLRQAYADRAKALAEQGIAIPLDAARAESQVLVAAQTLVNAKARLGNASDALAVLMGKELNSEFRANVSEGERVALPEGGVNLAARRDLEAEEIFIQTIEKQESSVWWSLFPTLELRGIGRVGPESLSNPDTFLWAVSLNLNWILYDGGARYARAEQLSIETEIARLELANLERSVGADQVRAMRDWRAANEAIEVARKNVEVSQNAYDMANARFDAGLATSIEVTEASDELFRAQLSLVQSELEADLAASRYRFTQGINK